MIDYLSLTLNLPPDKDYMEYHGKITEDSFRSQMYKYMCQLERARILFYPHEFSESRNASMPFTIIILNPKYFDCYEDMESYVYSIFNRSDFEINNLNISRIDAASDIPGINVTAIIATLNVKHIRMSTFRIINNTIYAGRNPKVRVYDKLDEIKGRLKKNLRVIEDEKKLLDLHTDLTRFEVAVSRPKINLKALQENPVRLVSYFDKLEFIKMTCSSPCGIMQYMYKHVNRKFRKQMEALQDMNLLEKIKETYISDVIKWFGSEEPF